MIGRKKRQDVRAAAGTQQGQQSPGLLRASIVGASKQMVQSVFGPPRAAAGGVAAVPGEGRQAYWDADTWYYALDPKRKTAMAIRFENGVARDVDFVHG